MRKKCLNCDCMIPEVITIKGKNCNTRDRTLCLLCEPLPKIYDNIIKDPILNKAPEQYKELSDREKILYNQKRKQYSLSRMLEKKIILMNKFKNKCELCGKQKEIENLFFHHRETEQKLFYVGNRSIEELCIEKLLEEIKKCNLYCKDCKNPRKVSEEMKKNLSEKRKKYLQENPDKHPWRSKDKFQSKPCENFKTFLRDLNIQFIEEFQPNIAGRYFSIDVAMPDKMIGIEINGSQHYLSDGELKPYYKERENLLEEAGWTIYQIHYSCCYNLTKLKEFFDKIENSEIKVEFDYFKYIPRAVPRCGCGKKLSYKCKRCKNCRLQYLKEIAASKPPKIEKQIKFKLEKEMSNECNFPTIPKRTKNLCICGKSKMFKSELCRNCNNNREEFHKTKIIWPDKETLQKLVWEKPSSSLCKELGVSDRAIGKRCEKLGIPKPPRGYWEKKKFGKL